MVKTLLEMSARITVLEQQVLNLSEQIASLSSNSTNSSKPPSFDGPRVIKTKKRKSWRSEKRFCKGVTSPFSSSSPEQYAVGRPHLYACSIFKCLLPPAHGLTAGILAGSSNRNRGSMRAPCQRTPKNRCGPVDRPVVPTRPIVLPLRTF